MSASPKNPRTPEHWTMQLSHWIRCSVSSESFNKTIPSAFRPIFPPLTNLSLRIRLCIRCRAAVCASNCASDAVHQSVHQSAHQFPAQFLLAPGTTKMSKKCSRPCFVVRSKKCLYNVKKYNICWCFSFLRVCRDLFAVQETLIVAAGSLTRQSF